MSLADLYTISPTQYYGKLLAIIETAGGDDLYQIISNQNTDDARVTFATFLTKHHTSNLSYDPNTL